MPFSAGAFSNYSLRSYLLQQVRIHDILDVIGAVNTEATLWTISSRPRCICLIFFGTEADGLGSQHRQRFLWLNLFRLVRGRGWLSCIMHVLVYVETMRLLVEGLDAPKHMFRIVSRVEGGSFHDIFNYLLGSHWYFTGLIARKLALTVRFLFDCWRHFLIFLNEIGIRAWHQCLMFEVCEDTLCRVWERILRFLIFCSKL